MKLRSKWSVVASLILGLGIAFGCSSSDDPAGGGGGGADASVSETGTTPPPASAVIGASGGTVTGPSGASVVVPSGALAEDTTITISVADASQYPALTGYVVDGQVFAFEPHGLAFSTPVTITLPVAAGGSGLVALRSSPGGSWSSIEAEIGTTAKITTTSFSYYCVARAAEPVDAGEDAGEDASAVGCDERSPDLTPRGTVEATGVVVASDNYPGLDLSNLFDGYATPRGNGGVMIQLSDYAYACGLSKASMDLIGGKEFQIFLYASNVTAGSYTGQHYITTRNASSPGATIGACTSAGFGDGTPPSGASTITISEIDGTHVAGSFTTSLGGAALSGTFDVPICVRGAFTPETCCTAVD